MNRFTKRLFTLLVCLTTALAACEDSYSEYSKKYVVRFNYMVQTSQQLAVTLGNYGCFCTIRKKVVNGVTKILMTSIKNSDAYTITESQKYFEYGLGGLIVGTSYEGEHVAYDLACPNCDRNNYLLSVADNGYATCNHCGLTYNLNAHGIIAYKSDSEKGNATKSDMRGLYRYRIQFNGTIVSVYN